MYERLIREAMQTPWAITQQYLGIVRDILVFRANGGRLTDEEIAARVGQRKAAPAPMIARAQAEGGRAVGRGGAVAVIPIYGVIAHRTFEASSGMTSTEVVGAMLQRAVNDEEISAILLDISSPGGTVEGVPELAAQVLAARKVKHVTAFSNALMASAAYWIGSQANEISVTPSGGVGSVGVYALFEDWSAHLEQKGIKINAISDGENKLEGAFWEPMSDDTRAFIQAEVTKTGDDFRAAVAKGRGTTAANVKKTYGSGRVFGADDAIARGMADKKETMDQAILRLVKIAAKGRPGMAAETGGVAIVADAAEPTAFTREPFADADAAALAARAGADRDAITIAVEQG